MTFSELIIKLCMGNSDAEEFLNLWSVYCHKVDDIIDKEIVASADNLMESQSLLLKLTTSKFFKDYELSLLPIILLAAESYKSSECYKVENKPGDRLYEWGIFIRHCGWDVARVVALIIGGEEHLKEMSYILRDLSLKEHYTKEGVAI